MKTRERRKKYEWHENVREGQNEYTYISEKESEMMLKSNEHMYGMSSCVFLFVD